METNDVLVSEWKVFCRNITIFHELNGAFFKIPAGILACGGWIRTKFEVRAKCDALGASEYHLLHEVCEQTMCSRPNENFPV